MNILGAKKKADVIYEHQSLGVLVSLSNENHEKVKSFQKKYKNAKKAPSDKVNGYKLILDEEFGSLKVDFSCSFNFLIKELKLFPLK